jgi:hypothetical protein
LKLTEEGKEELDVIHGADITLNNDNSEATELLLMTQ